MITTPYEKMDPIISNNAMYAVCAFTLWGSNTAAGAGRSINPHDSTSHCICLFWQNCILFEAFGHEYSSTPLRCNRICGATHRSETESPALQMKPTCKSVNWPKWHPLHSVLSQVVTGAPPQIIVNLRCSDVEEIRTE